MKYPQFRGIRCYRCNMWKRLNKSGVFRLTAWWGGWNNKRVAMWKRKRTGNRRAAYRTVWPAVWQILNMRKEMIEAGDDPGQLAYFPGDMTPKWKERMAKVVHSQEDFLRRKLNEQAEQRDA